MNPVAHLLFGALFATCMIAFGVELPRRREGLGRSSLTPWSILLVIIIFGGLAAIPQASRFFGDRKLDTGPVFNLFLFHDVLNLAGERFRLGGGLLDPPVTVFALGFGVAVLFLIYLRSEPSEGWNSLWRDVAYFCVIALCLIAIRSVVSGKSYVFLPKTYVFVHRDPYFVVGDIVFTGLRTPVVGATRDKALAVRDAFLAINSTVWIDEPPAVKVFLEGAAYSYIYPLEYDSLVSLMAILSQTPGLASEEDLARIIAAGSLPRTNIPTLVALGLPLIAFGLCGTLIHPGLDVSH